MKKALLAAAAFVALPVMAQAQTLQYPGFYAGLEGGVNWMLNTTILNQSVSPNTGFAVGGVFGYDFVGPRVEAEVVYRNNTNDANFGGTAIQNSINQLGVLANVLYDFNAGGAIVPYIGAGAGVAFVGPRHWRFAQHAVRLPGRSSASATTSTRRSASTSMVATTARPTRRLTA